MRGQTDRAATVLSSVLVSFACSDVLTFSGASVAKCLWTDSTTIRVTVASTMDSIQVGDALTLKDGKVKAICNSAPRSCAGYLFASSKTVFIAAPSNPISPIAIINTANVINRCSSIALDTTATSGKGSAAWSDLTWTVTSSSNNPTTAIETFLNSGEPIVTKIFSIDNLLLSNGSYTFGLCVQNMFLKTSCVVTNVTVEVNTNAPTVSLSGPTDAFRYDGISILGVASVPSCNGSPPSYRGLTPRFQLYKNTNPLEAVALISSSNNPFIFKIDAFQLRVKTDYVLQMIVTTEEGSISSAMHFFSVGRAGVKAIIAQGSYTTVHASSLVALDASNSYDLDFPDDPNDLRYRWDCAEYEPAQYGPCQAISNAGLDVFSSAHELSLPATLFTAGYKYSVTLYVKNEFASVPESIAAIIVSIQAGSLIPVVSFQGIKEKYNRDDRITIKSQISTATTFRYSLATWVAYYSGGELLNLSAIALTGLNKTLSIGLTLFDVTIARQALEARAEFVFRVSASYFPDEGMALAETHSEVVVHINGPPTGGTFAVTPLSGKSLNTSFFFFSSGWSDDAEDYPLTVLFASYTADPANSNLVRDYSAVSYMDAYIGAGLSHLAYLVTCVSSVKDIWGSSSFSSAGVEVKPIENVLKAAYAIRNLTDGKLVCYSTDYRC